MTRKQRRGGVFFGVLLGAALALLMICPAFAAEGIWIEGEKPASTEAGSVTPSGENVGRPAYLSGGSGIPGSLPDSVAGIPVGRKADALFFLQAARIDSRRSADEVKKSKQYEMADYVVHYADGQTLKVPVYAEISVDHYRQKAPAALPEAQIAWTKPYPGTDESAVAYSMQWNNPRPDVEIQSLDVTYGPDRLGVLALLAVTAATENTSGP